MGSWKEHKRQHSRLARGDQELFDRIDTLLAPAGTSAPIALAPWNATR